MSEPPNYNLTWASKNTLFILLLLNLLLLIIFYWPILSGSGDFYFKDITQFFEPHCRFIGQSLARGEFPLWNSMSYCGMPQIAISTPSVFFPANWLFAVLPFSKGLAVILISHQLLAGISMYAYARFLKMSQPAAAFIGSVICFSGYFFGDYTLVCTASWLCLSFCAFAYLSVADTLKQNILWTIIASVSICLTIFSGRAEIFAPGFVFLWMQNILLCFANNQKLEMNWLIAGRLIKAFCIGLLFSAPVLLPSMEWLPLSRRSEGLLVEEVLLFSSSWYDFLTIFLFPPLGDLRRLDANFLGLVNPMRYMPFLPAAYLGISVCVLSFWGVLAEQSKLVKLLLLFVFVGLLLSAGSNLPGMALLLQTIPALSILRFPVKLLIFPLVGITLLAGLGASELLAGRVKVWLAVIFSFILVVAGLALIVAGQQIILPFEVNFTTEKVRLLAQMDIAQSLLVTGLVALLLNLTAYYCKNKPLYRIALFALLFVSSIVGFLLHAQLTCAKFAPKDYFSQPSALASSLNKFGDVSGNLNSGRLMPFYLGTLTSPKSVIAAPERSAATYQYHRQIMYPNTNYDFAVPSVFGFEGSMVGEYYYFLLNTFFKSGLSASSEAAASTASDSNSRIPLYCFLQCCACEYVATQKFAGLHSGSQISVPLFDDKYFELLQENDNLNTRLYKLKATNQRAYLRHEYIVFEKRDKLLDTMYFAEKSGFNPLRTCLLEKEPDFASSNQSEQRSARSVVNSEHLSLESISNSKIKIRAIVKSPAVLVLADQYYPGWKAYVDGVEHDLLRVNGFFRAVALSPGEHKVVFSYEPNSLSQAFLLVLCGCIWLILLIYQLRKSFK